MAETIRGDNVGRVDAALEALAQNPARLEHERMRFDRSPRVIITYSHNSTLSPSSDPPKDEAELRDDIIWKLKDERSASRPYGQLLSQIREEQERTCGYESARGVVTSRWIEQGIWNDTWSGTAYGGVWKHEEPLQLDSDSEDEREKQPRSPIFLSSTILEPLVCPRISQEERQKQGIWNNTWSDTAYRGVWKNEEPLQLVPVSQDEREKQPRSPIFPPSIVPATVPEPPVRPRKSQEKRQKQRAIRERERQASRPFYQFFYQLAFERTLISKDDPTAVTATDINTTAYNSLKEKWIRREIWDDTWGLIPGMCWKHEKSLEEEIAKIDKELAKSRNRATEQPAEPSIPPTHVPYSIVSRIPQKRSKGDQPSVISGPRRSKRLEERAQGIQGAKLESGVKSSRVSKRKPLKK